MGKKFLAKRFGDDSDSYNDQKKKTTKQSSKDASTETTETIEKTAKPQQEEEKFYDKHGNEIKSKFYVKNTGVKFDDVRGIGDEKTELQDVVDFMRNPEKYNSL